MRWLWQHLVWGLGLCLLTGCGNVQAAQPGAGSPLDGPALLRRIQEASLRRSFTGTFVVSAGSQMSSTRITRYCDAQNQIERIETLDGQARQIFRHNDTVHVLWPRSHQALIQPREVVHQFPGVITPQAGNPLELYELQSGGGDERVAGHDAQVVLLKPRDGLRFAQRWWLERHSGLLLRADVLGEHGEVLESAAFSTLDIGPRIQPQPLLLEMNRLDGYKVSRPQLQQTDLGREGWSLKTPVAGFQPVSGVRRPAAGTTPEPEAMLQAIYSDGLTHVSIFIESYQSGSPRPETQAAVGATHVLTRRLGDWWITAMGDVPPATLRQFTQALERRRP